jgi:(p)ppGpp synthase/HD superfamily hydrolase
MPNEVRTMPTIDETIAFIKQAHAGQTDKAGNDYFHHPIAVMHRLPDDVDDDVRLAALLHDVIEDTPFTGQNLADMGYSERTLNAVELVTKTPGDPRSYAEKIDAIIASGNKDAIQLKLADMSENTDPGRLAVLRPEEREFFLKKYTLPLCALRSTLS